MYDCISQLLSVSISKINQDYNHSLSILWSRAAPCLPDNVVATLDCTDNSFAVQWCQTEGASVTYIAMAIGSDGSRLSCQNTGSSCTIDSLTCGLNYSVVVTTSSVDCGEIEGSDYFVMSGTDTMN